MFLSAIKFVAILSSGVFAFFALLGDNRDPNGQLSLWGRIAVAGVIVSTVLAAITLGIEGHETREMIKDLQRAAYPIFPTPLPRVAYSIELSLKVPSLASYGARLKLLTAQVRAQGASANFTKTSPYITNGSPEGDGKVTGLVFKYGSPAFPTQDSEPALYDWLTQLGVDIGFYNPRVPVNQFYPAIADLNLDQVSVKEALRLTYREDEETLEIEAEGPIEEIPLHSYRANGQVISLGDLGGERMVVTFTNTHIAPSLVDQELEIENAAVLAPLWLDLANRQFFIGRPETVQVDKTKYRTALLPNDILGAGRDLSVRKGPPN